MMDYSIYLLENMIYETEQQDDGGGGGWTSTKYFKYGLPAAGTAIAGGAAYYMLRRKRKELENRLASCGNDQQCRQRVQAELNKLKGGAAIKTMGSAALGGATGYLGTKLGPLAGMAGSALSTAGAIGGNIYNVAGGVTGALSIKRAMDQSADESLPDTPPPQPQQQPAVQRAQPATKPTDMTGFTLYNGNEEDDHEKYEYYIDPQGRKYRRLRKKSTG